MLYTLHAIDSVLSIAEHPEDPAELLGAELDRAKQSGLSRPLRTAAEKRVLRDGSPTALSR